MDKLGEYKIVDFPKNKQILSEIYEEFHKKHYMTGYLELDVSYGLQLIKEYKEKNQTEISYTGWLLKCIAEGISKYPKINSYRSKKKLVIFDDIDVIVMVERKIKNQVNPYPCVIRRANTKSLLDITQEIREFQTEELDESQQLLDQGLKVKLFHLLPKFMRKWMIKRQISDPFYMKRSGGTAVITSVGMFSNSNGWISGFGGITTMNFAIGGRSNKLELMDKDLIYRTYQSLTVNIDHDIIDGAPAARFISQVIELLKKGFGIPKSTSDL